MKHPFYKCNSKGNSFIIIFSPGYMMPCDKIIEICNSVTNEKVDGFISLDMIANKFDISDFTIMDYWNNDGSWETFCLNGMICSSLILYQNYHGHIKNKIVSNGLEYDFRVLENCISEIKLPYPIHMELNKESWYRSKKSLFQPFKIDNLDCYYINSGAKHIVIKSEDDKLFDDDLSLEKNLKKIRYNKLFLPDGVNVNIYRCKGPNAIQVKTYEKGIEAMMSSCSSGSYACAYHYYHCYEKSPRIKILNDGGTSEIVFKENGKNLFLSKGEIEYKGELDI